MQSTDGNQTAPETPEQPGVEAVAGPETRILASVKAVAQRIAERVQKALADTDTHAALPTEEHTPLPE